MARVGNSSHTMSSDAANVCLLLDAFKNDGQPFSRWPRKAAISELTKMLLVGFYRAAEFGVLGLFLPSWFRLLRDDSRLRANEGVLISLSRGMKVSITDRGMLTMINDCDVDPVSALLVYARMDEIDWLDSKALG